MRPKKVYPPEMAVTDADSLDRHSPIPLYQQLSDVLSRQIKQGILKPGDGLPSEYDLTHRYGVSRYVVRQTLASLSRQGMITTEQGRGSFVSYRRIEKALSVLQSYHKNMSDAGLQVEVQIIQREIVAASKEVAKELALKPGEPVFHLERVSYTDDVPINVLISDIHLEGPQLDLLAKFPGGSLYEYLAKACHVKLDRAHSDLEVGFAGELESRLLDLPRGAVLMSMTSWVFDPRGKPLEFTRIVYPATMFRFSFESQAAVPVKQAPSASSN